MNTLLPLSVYVSTLNLKSEVQILATFTWDTFQNTSDLWQN